MSNAIEQAIVKWSADQRTLHKLLRDARNVSHPTSRTRSGENTERHDGLSSRVVIDDSGEHVESSSSSTSTGRRRAASPVAEDGAKRRRGQEPIGLSVGQFRYEIPGLGRDYPYPMQLPDGRRYPGDTQRWSEEYMENEDAKRELVQKDPNYLILNLVAGFIEDNYPTHELYEFRDTSALARQRAERARKLELADRVRLTQLERVLRQQPATAETQNLLERLQGRLDDLTRRYSAMRESTLKLANAKLDQKALAEFTSMVNDWERVYPPLYSQLPPSGEPAMLDVTQANAVRRKMGLQDFGAEAFAHMTRGELDRAHRDELKEWFAAHPRARPAVAEAYAAWAAAQQEPEDVARASIGAFNQAFGSGMNGRARTTLRAKRGELTQQIAALEETEQQRAGLRQEMEQTSEQVQAASRELQLALRRREQLQEEIQEILERQNVTFDQPNVEWIDRPSNSGKYEIRNKVSAALHKAYVTVCQAMGRRGLEPSMEELTQTAHITVKLPFADLIYHYYWWDGLPKRYRGEKDKKDMKEEIQHLIEFFGEHVYKAGDGVLHSQRETTGYYGMRDRLALAHGPETAYVYSQPLGFQPVF